MISLTWSSTSAFKRGACAFLLTENPSVVRNETFWMGYAAARRVSTLPLGSILIVWPWDDLADGYSFGYQELTDAAD